MTKRAGQIGLPHPGGADDEHVLVMEREVTGKERPPGGPVKTAGRAELHVFRAGGQA